jgi:hypothetical protein
MRQWTSGFQGNAEFVDRALEKYDGNIKKEPKKKEYTLSTISG